MIKSDRVFESMAKIDRSNYTKTEPYRDAPQSIGFRATISAPHMHAIALELLNDHLNEGDKALDVGCGSGYLTACMAAMIGASGRVIGVDHIPELVNLAESNVQNDNPNFLQTRVKFIGMIDSKYFY